MTDEYRISQDTWVVEEYPDTQDVQNLRQQLGSYNVARGGINQGTTLAIFLRDERRQLLGGVYGWLWGECLELDYLWVHAELRGRGTGKQLVLTMEGAAAARGCRRVVVDTFSFQAPQFYQRLGFRVFGVIEGYGEGHQKFFLEKRIGLGNTQSNAKIGGV
jgi:GNAT superfamily N-acetyltransferase